jgi:hypothetical protein
MEFRKTAVTTMEHEGRLGDQHACVVWWIEEREEVGEASLAQKHARKGQLGVSWVQRRLVYGHGPALSRVGLHARLIWRGTWRAGST